MQGCTAADVLSLQKDSTEDYRVKYMAVTTWMTH